jgi:FtsP/CotA-like multicopper oxidase with cupredoxin domain
VAGLIRQQPRRVALLAAITFLVTGVLLAIHPDGRAHATSGGDPYSVTFVTDTNPDPNIVETTLIADDTDVDLGTGVTVHAQTFNGQIPGPTFKLKVGDTVIVHYENHLTRESGIHWHGIELTNSMDGTPFTQNQVQPGGKFLYKFKVSRPGIFWYHPHHHASTNQVFKGLYGMILITDPNESALQGSGTLPSAANTLPIVLSDTTVCHDPGGNDPFGGGKTYDPALPWVGPLDPLPAPQTGNESGGLPAQATPHPLELCETAPIDVDGNPLPAATTFHVGDIPNNQTLAANGRVNEGQTVLTNGKNVGGRAGSPTAPGALAGGASTYTVKAGQGLRLEMLNAATTRFMRLRLTDQSGALVPLVRVGGEGGLIDNAVVEGGVIGGFDTKYKTGELLLDPGSRTDVVIAVPASAVNGDVLTMWTEDYDRTGQGFSNVPTVPVMHLSVSGSVAPFSISAGTGLRSATGDPVPVLSGPVTPLLDQTTFSPVKVGFVPNAVHPPDNPDRQTIRLTQTGGPGGLGINDVFGTHDVGVDYTVADHLQSTRYAKVGDTLELFVENATGGAHHPYHLHGFSMQPIALLKTGGGGPDYIWPYHEFRDNIDVPPGYTLKFRTKLEDRALADGTTPGGVLGRWLFHCHIFFHATNGMLGEVVVVAPNGNEKPDINADDVSVDATAGQIASMTGTSHDIDGDAVTFSASIGTVTDNGGGLWTWNYPTTGAAGEDQFVYVKATDAGGKSDEAVFFLNVNPIKPVKQAVLTQASTLLAGSTTNPDKDKLQKVVQKLTISLEPARWIDDNHIRVDHGNEVFDREKDAVKLLMDLINDPKSLISDATLQGMIDQLEQVDQSLANIAVAEAIAASGDPKKIAEAQAELAKAAVELSKNHFDAAIDHYKRAWQKAKEA